VAGSAPERGPFRTGDIRHSVGSTTEIRRSLGFVPGVPMEDGLRRTLDWYLAASKLAR
jgi:nucleoside-diphosphate-sugar epimerase